MISPVRGLHVVGTAQKTLYMEQKLVVDVCLGCMQEVEIQSGFHLWSKALARDTSQAHLQDELLIDFWDREVP